MRGLEGKPTRLLVGSELVDALASGDVFHADSWSRSQLRHTAYDLRIARDLCVVPQPTGDGGRIHARYPRGEPGPVSFDLLPGESAFVSTMERIHLPWSIAGAVGMKFSMAAQGLLVLTGSVVDPGFGLVRDGQGDWVPSVDERLHFVLANVGPDPIQITAGVSSIATIQFTAVPSVEAPKRAPVVSEGFTTLNQSFLADASTQPVLAYFRQVSDLRRDVDRLTTQNESYVRRAELAIQGVNTVVLFGIYLLAVTILGVVVATFVGAVGRLVESSDWWQRGLAIGFLSLAGGSLVMLTWKVSQVLRRTE